jgi:hypothetical protein
MPDEPRGKWSKAEVVSKAVGGILLPVILLYVGNPLHVAAGDGKQRQARSRPKERAGPAQRRQGHDVPESPFEQ